MVVSGKQQEHHGFLRNSFLSSSTYIFRNAETFFWTGNFWSAPACTLSTSEPPTVSNTCKRYSFPSRIPSLSHSTLPSYYLKDEGKQPSCPVCRFDGSSSSWRWRTPVSLPWTRRTARWNVGLAKSYRGVVSGERLCFVRRAGERTGTRTYSCYKPCLSVVRAGVSGDEEGEGRPGGAGEKENEFTSTTRIHMVMVFSGGERVAEGGVGWGW